MYASYGQSTHQEGWHPPLEPGEYYVESWMPDWASIHEENVIRLLGWCKEYGGVVSAHAQRGFQRDSLTQGCGSI